MNPINYWLVLGEFTSTDIPEFSTSTWIMAVIALVIFIIVSMYIFRRLKESSKEDAYLGPHALLTKFREMREQGDLSEEEFKAIKLLMADKIANSDMSDKSQDT